VSTCSDPGDNRVASLGVLLLRIERHVPTGGVDPRQRRALGIGRLCADGLIITPDGKKVYVSSGDTGTVKVIDTAQDMVTRSMDVGAKPAGIAVTSDVVSVGGTGEAVIVDTSSDAILKRAPVAQAHSSCITATDTMRMSVLRRAGRQPSSASTWRVTTRPDRTERNG
jgi:YVTN family beta-propeller protein